MGARGMALPGHAPAGTLGQAPDWGAPGATGGTWRDVLRIVLVALGSLGLIAMLWIVSLSASSLAQLASVILLAMIPLVIVLAVVRWIDRWEPEPWSTLTVAFLWGAGVSTAISLVVNTTTVGLVAGSSGDLEDAMFFSAVVSAPIIEELTKGLGVLIIFLIWRRTFNGAVDGLVYASVVAAGFAFAENISYFVQYNDMLVYVFIIRGVFSPFAHVSFAACTGLAIGLSARSRSRAAWVWWTPLGLVGAIILHAFWNGVASSSALLYLLVEVPLFLVCIGMVFWLRWAERMTMRTRLSDYARAGWFFPTEVTMLTTGSGRRRAKQWAGWQGPAVAQAMARFQKASAQLAQLRQQAVDGHAEPDFAQRESRLLAEITSSRKVFLGQY